jgi:hypothetical protein
MWITAGVLRCSDEYVAGGRQVRDVDDRERTFSSARTRFVGSASMKPQIMKVVNHLLGQLS